MNLVNILQDIPTIQGFRVTLKFCYKTQSLRPFL